MAWHLKNSMGFSSDPHLEVSFKLKTSADNPPLPTIPEWRFQLGRGERIANPPTGLEAIREISETSYAGVLDFLKIAGNPVVSDRFKALVQELEPGKHQFIGIALFDAQEKRIDAPYWLLNTLQAVDAVIYRSSYEPDKRAAKWRALGRKVPEDLLDYGRRTNETCIVDEMSARGLHLWRDTGSPGSSDFALFFSDLLVTRLRKARLRGIELSRAAMLTEAGLQIDEEAKR